MSRKKSEKFTTVIISRKTNTKRIGAMRENIKIAIGKVVKNDPHFSIVLKKALILLIYLTIFIVELPKL